MPRPESSSRAVQRYMRQRLLAKQARASRDEAPAPGPSPTQTIEPIGPSQRVTAERAHEVVDLLNDQPAEVVDVERLSWALSFGFAGGDIGGLLIQAMRRAPVAASDWDPGSFAGGLFVQELIRTCMHVRLGGFEPVLDAAFIARVLTHPPRDRNVAVYRQGILRELAGDSALRTRFSDLYRTLHRMRELLDSEGPSRELDGRRRRLDVLTSIRDALAQMATSFSACTSGLARIDRFGQAVQGSEPFRHLVELLDYENHLASVDLELRIGSDGRVRHFAITRVSENRTNGFYQSPLGRWLSRAALFMRGFAMGEPEIANRWIDAVYEGVQDNLPALFQLLGEMEVYLATLAFKDTAEARGLKACLPDFTADGAGANGDTEPGALQPRLEGLFNPLLFAHPGKITACDLGSDAFRATTLVTGPNSGGKTRLLQAIAIAQMLGEAGVYMPAASATLDHCSGLFVSLIEEARADQKEGRLGTELMRIRELFERARPGSLIILDELCSGTNPSEGEDIIRLVLSLLFELHASVFITTHFLQFATRLGEEAANGMTSQGRLSFLQVELDGGEQPTYRFVPGVARTSLAHQIAARLGVTRDELLALVQRNATARK
jgi:DNA mismatch repair protein MutS2